MARQILLGLNNEKQKKMGVLWAAGGFSECASAIILPSFVAFIQFKLYITFPGQLVLQWCLQHIPEKHVGTAVGSLSLAAENGS